MLERELEALPGMLHASVSYAAGLVFAAYDTQQLNRSQLGITHLRDRGLGQPLVAQVLGRDRRDDGGHERLRREKRPVISNR